MTTPAELVKGQNAPLGATSVRIAVDVQAPTDVSALLVTESAKVRSDADFVFFNQPEGPGVRCVRDGQSWVLQIDLAAVPAEISTVRAVVNLETPGQRFGSLPAPVATVTDPGGATLAQYRVTGLDSEMIMVALELYRRGADWKVRAVGQGYAGGLADLIRDHGVSVDDAPAAAAQQTPAPPAPAGPPPDTGGAFGSMTPPAAPAARPDTGGAFGSMTPPAPAGPPPDTGGAFGAGPAFPPPSAPPAAFPPPSAPPAAFPPPTAQPAAFPPPQGAPQAGPPPTVADPGLTAGRPVSLQKGQRVSLSKSGGGSLTVVRMGLGWDPIQKRGMFGNREVDIDLDASAVLYSAGNPVDLAFYNNLTSKDGSVQHQGDNRTGAGDGDDETIVIDLGRVGAHIDAIVFIVTSYEGQTFQQVQNAFCRLIDHTNGGELARYTLTGGAAVTGMVMAKVSRSGSGWQMQAIGEGIQAKTPSEAFPQIPRFL